MRTRFSLPAALLAVFALCACRSVVDELQPEQLLRVLTYNIHHGEGTDGVFDYQRLANVINDLAPDVVALQEVDNKTARASGVDQTLRLAQLTGLHGVFGNAMDYSGGEYGEAILSRFPIAEYRAHPLPFTEGREPRTALAARIVPDNGLPEFVLIGTHLCHQDESLRLQQVTEINALFPPSGVAPVILAGDLNARRGSPPMEALLDARWVDASSGDARIDYVLIRPADPWVIVERYVHDERVASDHRPVLTILRWEGEDVR